MNSLLIASRILLLTLLPLAAGAADGGDPDATARLLRGEIVEQEVHSEPTGGSARMQLLVRAPARAIWDVLVSCELAFNFVRGLELCEVLEDTGGRAVVHQAVDIGWFAPRYDFVFESLRRPYRRIEFRLLEGNLKSMRGSWQFSETEQGTLVDYEIDVRPSALLPRFLVRRSIHKTMPNLLACIRGLAGGSVVAEQERKDLQRCPNPPP